MSRAERRRRGHRGKPEGGSGKAPPNVAWGMAPALVATVLILLIVAYFAWLSGNDPESYYRSVQEDAYVEWATFWGFVGAAVAAAVAARRKWGAGRLPWFAVGLALFGVLVAMEEISWGQRLLGFRAPEYFLAHNYQQELTAHNIVGAGLRTLGLRGVIVGYGVVLPLLALWRPTRDLLERLGVTAPSPGLVPAFLGILLLQVAQPWRFTNEVVECLLGLGILVGVLLPAARPEDLEPGASARPSWTASATVAGVFGAVFVLGFVTAAATRRLGPGGVQSVQRAEGELEALRQDLLEHLRVRGTARAIGCGFVSRLHTSVQEVGLPELKSGRFTDLVAGDDRERAVFFLDPWDLPYWLTRPCPDGGAGEFTLVVYSFGPNRRRDSTPTVFREDDLWVEVRPGI